MHLKQISYTKLNSSMFGKLIGGSKTDAENVVSNLWRQVGNFGVKLILH